MKFKTTDERYLAQRKQLSDKYGPRELWSVIDHWPLYCGVSNLARFLAIADIVKETLALPGHVAEFGSWRGANLLFMAKLLRILDPHGPKVVHCFDSFEGLTEFSAPDGSARELRGQYQGSLEELREIIALYEMSDEIILHRGVIEETLPAVLEVDKGLSFSLVYCDTDLYASTKTILDSLHTRLVPGGVFVLDEWNYENFPGEAVAANEFLAAHGAEYEACSVPRARQPSLILRKRR